MRVLLNAAQVSTDWLTSVLGRTVTHFKAETQASNWSSQVPLSVSFDDRGSQALRLKICLGETFGRSELDYYTKDYVGLVNAPLVRCYDAQFEQGVGYHVLLDDLSETYYNRRDVVPTLDYGLAVAEALGRLHQHHWESESAPSDAVWNRYFAEIRPGVAPLEQATGQEFAERFVAHEKALRTRGANPHGMSLLHGDLNSTNILTPKNAEAPVYFLDRQPFDWSLTYGLASYDLAYFLVIWWPQELRSAHEAVILRHWYEAIGQPGYSWEQAQSDWALSVEQCLHVPMEWCSKPETAEKMRWLWELQLARVQAASESLRGQAA